MRFANCKLTETNEITNKLEEKENVKSIFNKYAYQYQDKYMNVFKFKPSLDYLLEKIITTNPNILDVGCGPGNLSKYLLDKLPKAIISGLDIAPEMIKLAKLNMPKHHFQVQDVRTINKLSSKYDIIISGFCLPYFTFSEAEKFIQNSKEILNNSGLIFISVMESNENRVEQITSSSGEATLETHFYSYKFLTEILLKNNFELSKTFRVKPEADNYDNDLIIICKKK